MEPMNDSPLRGIENGVLLQFDQPLGPERSLDPANYQISSWEYKRTRNMGPLSLNRTGRQVRTNGSLIPCTYLKTGNLYFWP